MAKFLNTSATTYYLEDMIKQASERLILISPFLRFNERIRELLEDKNRLKMDIRVVYGKNELQPEEIAWLKTLEYVRLSFCKNLHAKCYLSEQSAIVTSMNLYEFSQVNNNEMGILIQREFDSALYAEAYQEALRLIRISDEIKLSVERIPAPAGAKEGEAPTLKASAPAPSPAPSVISPEEPENSRQVSTTQLAKQNGIPPKDLFSRLQKAGWIAREGESWTLTSLGQSQGGEVRRSKQYGDYIVWPSALKLP
ncbi:DNA repair protein [bacterium]|nr:DNA repair protein [bacterium]